jgi:hypothetical protein
MYQSWQPRRPDEPLIDLTTDEIWNRLGVQVFNEYPAGGHRPGFLIKDGRAVIFGMGWGKDAGTSGIHKNFTSLLVTDLDRNGKPELAFACYGCSGRCSTAVEVCFTDGPKLVQVRAPQFISGPPRMLFIRKTDDYHVVVEYGEYDDDAPDPSHWSWKSEGILGTLVLETTKQGPTPRIIVRDDLSSDIVVHESRSSAPQTESP